MKKKNRKRYEDIKNTIDELNVILLKEKDKRRYAILEKIKLVLARELDYID